MEVLYHIQFVRTRVTRCLAYKALLCLTQQQPYYISEKCIPTNASLHQVPQLAYSCASVGDDTCKLARKKTNPLFLPKVRLSFHANVLLRQSEMSYTVFLMSLIEAQEVLSVLYIFQLKQLLLMWSKCIMKSDFALDDKLEICI